MPGAFYQPRCVLIDTATLDTLPPRELASGISEIIKYGLIADAELFEWLEANMEKLLARDPAAIAHAVERSCLNKVRAAWRGVVASGSERVGPGARCTQPGRAGRPVACGVCDRRRTRVCSHRRLVTQPAGGA